MIILDAGALIGLERGDRRVVALLDRLRSAGSGAVVPAGVVGQVWRGGARQARLARFLRLAEVVIVPLDEDLARAAGELCGRAGTSDVVDASVVLVAHGEGDGVVTSDPDDLRRLSPAVRLFLV